MRENKLIPIHVHSNASLLDSLIKIDDYVSWAKKNELKHIALTDHGSLSNSISFYKKCKENDISPILGIEIYTTMDNVGVESKTKDNYHLILLAKNKTGWLNLIKLHNLSFDNFYYKPRVTYDDLKTHSDGLICTSACLGGALSKSITNKDQDALIYHTQTLKSIFKEDFYIELQDHNFAIQRPVNNLLIQVARQFNIKLIAANDSHYINKEDAYAHQVLLCKQTGSKISDPNKMSFETSEFYLKNTEEMRSQLSYLGNDIFEECVSNTNEISSKIEEYNILSKEYSYPRFGEKEETIKELSRLVSIGFKNRFFEKNIDKQKYIERLTYELKSIYNIGFVDYFLMLHDLVLFCEKENIYTNFGRGSAASSLVLYCLNVTHLDPIEHKLIFERFLNPERVSMPDVDFDCDDTDRQKVVEYLNNKYGNDYTCSISTYGELTSVSSFKAVASVMELPFQEANRISKDLIQTGISLKDNLEQSEELNRLYNTRSDIQDIINIAMKLEGGKEKAGLHACAVVISNNKLDTLTPIVKRVDTSGNSVSATCFEMKEVDGDLMLLKLDILGLKNLSIVKECIERTGLDIDFKKLDFKDEKTYRMLSAGNNVGVFQLESDIMKHLCVDIQPKTLADISVINAGARPGALESGLTQSFINRRKGIEEIDYIVDGMEEYLKDTLGLPIMQENIMQLSQVMAGYTGAEADNLRKCIGKKIIDKLLAERDKFVRGCISNGHSESRANEIFDMIEKFGRYGFCASHSMAYSALSYTTAYLKANYPLEYMTALINANSDNLDKLTPYIDECYRIGINVLPPDINKSGYKFEHDSENNAIRFGFNGIKHVGDSSIEPVILERQNGLYGSIKDLLQRVPSLNKTALESLIKVGAFNKIEDQPYKYLHLLEYIQKAKNKTDYKNGKIDLYQSLVETYIKDTSKHIPEVKNLFEQRKGLTAKKADKELKAKIDARLSEIYAEETSKFENMQFKPEIQVLKDYEMELIGFPVSNNPKKQIMELADYIDNTSLSEIKEEKIYGEMYSFIGKIKSIRPTKNGSYFMIITDEVDEITTFIKRDTYEKIGDKLSNNSNYFRIWGSLNKSSNPDKYADNLKLESIRYFNASMDKELVLRCPENLGPQNLKEVLTNIKNDAIMNSEDINYRLSVMFYDENMKLHEFRTKIDYWVNDIQSIGSIIVRYGLTVVN